MLRRPYSVGVLGGDLVNDIARSLSRGGIYLSTADIQNNVDELEDYLEGRGVRREDELIAQLTAKLAKDRELGGGQGLYRSRRQFYISCYAARHLHSVDLAEALLEFLDRNASQIDQDETSFLVTEWCHGLVQLRGLVNKDRWNDVQQRMASRGPPLFEEWRRPGVPRLRVGEVVGMFQNMMLNDYGSGRRRLQPYDFQVRELSAPARRPSVMDMPSYPRTGYSSPQLSPSYDAFDRLQEQQHRQQWDIELLGYRIDNLRHRD